MSTDNQGKKKVVVNDSVNQRTIHIDVRIHIIQNGEREKQNMLNHCRTEDVTADYLTKPLGRIKPKTIFEM